eukprot:872589-Amphidinium_carterae.1
MRWAGSARNAGTTGLHPSACPPDTYAQHVRAPARCRVVPPLWSFLHLSLVGWVCLVHIGHARPRDPTKVV